MSGYRVAYIATTICLIANYDRATRSFLLFFPPPRVRFFLFSPLLSSRTSLRSFTPRSLRLLLFCARSYGLLFSPVRRHVAPINYQLPGSVHRQPAASTTCSECTFGQPGTIPVHRESRPSNLFVFRSFSTFVPAYPTSPTVSRATDPEEIQSRSSSVQFSPVASSSSSSSSS